MGELCDDAETLEKLRLEPGHSVSKKRRILNQVLEGALEKLQKTLLS